MRGGGSLRAGTCRRGVMRFLLVARHIIIGQSLQHAEAKSCAANAAAGEAECGTVQFIECAIELFSVLLLTGGKPRAVSVIGVQPSSRLQRVLVSERELRLPALPVDFIRLGGQH